MNITVLDDRGTFVMPVWVCFGAETAQSSAFRRSTASLTISAMESSRTPTT